MAVTVKGLLAATFLAILAMLADRDPAPAPVVTLVQSDQPERG